MTDSDGERAAPDDAAGAQGERSPVAGHNAHPVEPAEGARQPGESTRPATPPHPDQPAEGER